MGWGRGDAQKHQHQDSSKLGGWGMLPWWQAGSHRPSTKGTCLPALGPYRVTSYSSPSHQVTWPSPVPSLHIWPLYRHGSKDLLLLLPVANAILVLILLRLLWVLLLSSEWNKVSPMVPAYGEVSWTVLMLIPPPQPSSLRGRGWCVTVPRWGKGPRDTFPRLKVSRYCWEGRHIWALLLVL